MTFLTHQLDYSRIGVLRSAHSAALAPVAVAAHEIEELNRQARQAFDLLATARRAQGGDANARAANAAAVKRLSAEYESIRFKLQQAQGAREAAIERAHSHDILAKRCADFVKDQQP